MTCLERTGFRHAPEPRLPRDQVATRAGEQGGVGWAQLVPPVGQIAAYDHVTDRFSADSVLSPRCAIRIAHLAGGPWGAACAGLGPPGGQNRGPL